MSIATTLVQLPILLFTGFCSSLALSLAIPAAILWPNGLSTPIVADPPTWIGSPLPLLDFLSESDRKYLTAGPHSVVLFSHQCEICRLYTKKHRFAPDDRLIDVDVFEAKELRLQVPIFHLVKRVKYIGVLPWVISLQNGIVKATDQVKDSQK